MKKYKPRFYKISTNESQDDEARDDDFNKICIEYILVKLVKDEVDTYHLQT